MSGVSSGAVAAVAAAGLFFTPAAFSCFSALSTATDLKKDVISKAFSSSRPISPSSTLSQLQETGDNILVRESVVVARMSDAVTEYMFDKLRKRFLYLFK